MSSGPPGSSSFQALSGTGPIVGKISPNSNESKQSREIQMSGLLIVATPIGNAADITKRALKTLAKVDLVACEDTRVTTKLFKLYGLTTPMILYHEHNAKKQRPKLIKHLKNGKIVALVSDAGMPTISDPGYKLIRACIENEIPISCIPGASVVPTALALSGLPTDRFFFQGFLPAKRAHRQQVLAELATIPSSLIFLESAKRLANMLSDASKCLGKRDAAVARELTKQFEEIRRGALGDLAKHYNEKGPPRGEVTVIISPPYDKDPELDTATLDNMLIKLMTQNSVRDAVNAVAIATGLPKRIIYKRAINLPDNEL